MRRARGFARQKLIGWTLIAVLCLSILLALHVNRQGRYSSVLAGGPGLSGADIDTLQRMNEAYERISNTVQPAIVSIQSTQVVQIQQSPLFNDPFFRQFFGRQIPQEQREHALGSGVILSADGYIVTNNHVIEHASDIKVELSDKRVFKGKVVGADSQTDVAVVKIDGSGLPTSPVGDSSTLHVGDIVMAFGNPFGLNFTVTRGSVSALGRSGLNIERLEDFIQTDAAINPGNSGGALVNIRGQVIGINTAILSNGGMSGQGGFQGIGFAIPSNVVRPVMESLISTGQVKRGFMGVRLEAIDSDLAHQFQLPDVSGALVGDVSPGSPADKAGLKAGDVIRSFNGQPIDGPSSLQFMVAQTAPGTAVSLGVWRDARLNTIKLTLGDQPAKGLANVFKGQAPSRGTLRGISVQDLTPHVRQQLGLDPTTPGVVITEVDPKSAAAMSGLQPGDVIITVNRQTVNSAEAFDKLASSASGQVLLQVSRQGASAYIVITPSPQGQGNNGMEGQ